MTKVMMPRELPDEAKELLGEFHEWHVEICWRCSGDGGYLGTQCARCGGSGRFRKIVPISWPTIKAIYAKAVEGLGE